MPFSSLLGASSAHERRSSRAKRPSSSSRTASHASTHSHDGRTSSQGGPSSPPPPEYIFDASQLSPVDPPAPDLRQLNNSLEALAAAFPDIQIEVFREMLAQFDGESRLALVADALLKSRTQWVKGRWKTKDGAGEGEKKRGEGSGRCPTLQGAEHSGRSSAAPGNEEQVTRTDDVGEEPERLVPLNESFRSTEYKKAVRDLALHEFKGLSKSTVNAILAESNYSYLDSRPTLVSVSSRSWRFTIQAWFFRRRTPSNTTAQNSDAGSPALASAETHPLVIWRSSGRGSIVPTLKATGNAELDRELYEELIVPLQEQARDRQVMDDRAMAKKLNEEEAEEQGATVECLCCYADVPFEELATCSADGHFLCFGCVRRTVQEAVFGQGWSSVDTTRETLKCFSAEDAGCQGHIPVGLLRRAMLDEPKGFEILQKMERRLADHSITDSGLPLVRCPFCDYIEVDDGYYPRGPPRLRLRLSGLIDLVLLTGVICTIPFLLPLVLLSSFVCVLLSTQHTLGDSLLTELRAAMERRRTLSNRCPKFTCRSRECGVTSCLLCSKEWIDIHVCNESSLTALRTQIEQAMSMAVKRVCPKCNTSFVKSSGCNKLVCVCGYKMCYVCRANISEEGYRHFCDHFRPDGMGGQCKQCERCSLWQTEDTERVLKEAREEAERKWAAEQERKGGEASRKYSDRSAARGLELNMQEKEFIRTGVAGQGRGRSRNMGWKMDAWKVPTLAEICDAVVGMLFA